MLVTVTGASGHLGGHLVRQLLAEGHHIRALVYKDGHALDGLDVERVEGDVLALVSLRRAFAGVEVVFHLAALVSIRPGDDERLQAINVGGPRNVVAACREAGVRRLIHFSSVHAISPFPVEGVVDETRPPSDNPKVPAYDRSKAAGEREVMAGVAAGLDAVIVNPTGCIGPLDQKPSPMGQALLQLATGKLPALVNGGFNWVDARDVAASAIAAEKIGRRGERYLLGGHWHSLRETANLVAEVTGRPAPRFTSPLWLARASLPFVSVLSKLTGKPLPYTETSLHSVSHHRNVSSDKAARELGHSPRPHRETIADTIAWFQQAGRL